ncbi:kinase-like domain-containing protein [Thelephora terrestris]|uniref:Kinase-like domain-containing protein n=1 Tax=Thelephora terrestris TaxID=56493 RepID=A0A9P6L8D4_9AGAM|nr:kinase-like domain-containing protein [Thelephora terrestris]
MDNGLYAMVTPWMQNGNIVDYVREEPQTNPLELLEDATLGLQYLHSMDLAHGDLKGSNILISEDGHACLTDVGTTRVAGDMSSATATIQTSTTEGGLTVRWSPPELIDPERIGSKIGRPTKKSDVYSMAMTIYQVLTDRVPYYDRGELPAMLRIIQGERPQKPIFVITRGYTEDLWEITTRCWDEKPLERPIVDDLLKALKSAAKQWKPTLSFSPQDDLSPTLYADEFNLCTPSEHEDGDATTGLSTSPPVLPPSTAKNETSLEHVPGGPPVERSQIPTTLEKQHTQEVPASLPETQLGKPTLTVSRKDEIEVTMPGVKANSPSVLGLTAPASSRLPVDSGIPSQLQPGDTNRTSKLPEPFKDGQQALQRLVSGSAPRDELSSLIETVVSNVRADAVVDHLQGIDAQTFVDVLDQALDGPDFPLEIRNECVRLLYTTCAGHTLLPRSMCLELPGDTVGDVQCRGGFGIVSKRGYRGQEVAVKALRGLSSEKMSKRFWKEVITWRAVQHPNVLPLVGVVMTRDRFSMVSEWMANGNIKKFVEARQSANRYKLLADATKGLIHVHCQGIIHGDLKAANILINQNGHACLADFGLATIASDTTNTTFSDSLLGGGTTRWKSPELFDPEEFGLTERRRTKSSDCYALGMAVYEVLSGKVPFYDYQPDVVVVPKILDGDRPERPRGPWFTDDIWDTLEWCWKPMPGDRPSAEDVLHRLRKASMPSPAQMIEGPLIMDPPMQEWELHAKEKEEERMTRLLIPQ